MLQLGCHLYHKWPSLRHITYLLDCSVRHSDYRKKSKALFSLKHLLCKSTASTCHLGDSNNYHLFINTYVLTTAYCSLINGYIYILIPTVCKQYIYRNVYMYYDHEVELREATSARYRLSQCSSEPSLSASLYISSFESLAVNKG